MTEEIQDLLWQQLKDKLHSNILEVVFTKVNGERRDMTCTLIPELLPKSQTDQFDITKEAKDDTYPNLQNVWDLEKNDWRCIKRGSIISINVVELEDE